MAVEHFTPDIDGDENLVQIAALTPTDNAVIIGNGSAWTAESGGTLRTSLGLAIGSDVMAYDADLTSWGGVTRASGFDTFAATPTSSNLRALLTDESGSGDLLFAGGALGTPDSGVLTNCTGLPNASVVGLGTAAVVNTGTSGATIPLLNGTLSWSGVNTFTNASDFAGIFGKGTPTGTPPTWNTAVDILRVQGNGTSNATIQIYTSDGAAGSLQFSSPDGRGNGALSYDHGTNAMNLATDGVLNLLGTAVQANSDPVMTRGAAETMTGVKSLSGAGARLLFTGAGTSAAYADFANTTGRLLIGIDSSVGGNFFGGSSAYASIISSQANTALILATNSTPSQTISNAGAMRFHAYGAGALATDASGNVTATSDERLKYVSGNFKRGLADLRAMDGPVEYQWIGEQIELAENADTLSETHAKLIEAKAAFQDDDKDEDRRLNVVKLEGELKQKTYLDSLTREQTTYTGWTAQGVRKGIPEAVKSGPDGVLNFDDRPILAAMYNALLDMASRVEALEAAAQ